MTKFDPQTTAEARALADAQIAEIFKPQAIFNRIPTVRAGGDLAAAADSPLVSRLQACLRCVDMREGLLIEHVIRLALGTSPRFLLIGKKVVSVTETDRAVANRNPHVPLNEITVPEPGEPVGRAEIDCIAFDRDTGTVIFADIKRSGTNDRNLALIRAGAIAALRALQREGVRFRRCELLHVHWYARAGQAGIVTRDTVDATLNASVRDLVEDAVRHYLVACDREVRALVAAITAAELNIPAAMAPAPWEDEEAILRAFGRDLRRPQ